MVRVKYDRDFAEVGLSVAMARLFNFPVFLKTLTAVSYGMLAPM